MKLNCKSKGWGRTEGSEGVLLRKEFGSTGMQGLVGVAQQQKGYFRTKDRAAGHGTKENWGLRDEEDLDKLLNSGD